MNSEKFIRARIPDQLYVRFCTQGGVMKFCANRIWRLLGAVVCKFNGKHRYFSAMSYRGAYACRCVRCGDLTLIKKGTLQEAHVTTADTTNFAEYYNCYEQARRWVRWLPWPKWI
jgi:hypothetical protein